MPFQSEKQRRFLWAEHPDIAKRWAHEYPNQKKLPMYAHKTQSENSSENSDGAKAEKSAALGVLKAVLRRFNSHSSRPALNKTSESIMKRVEVPHSGKAVAAGDEHVMAKKDVLNTSGSCKKLQNNSAVLGLFKLQDGKNNAQNSISQAQKLAQILEKFAVDIRLGKKHKKKKRDKNPDNPEQEDGPEPYEPSVKGIDTKRIQQDAQKAIANRAWEEYRNRVYGAPEQSKSKSQAGPVAAYAGTKPQKSPSVTSNNLAASGNLTNVIGLKGPMNTKNGVPTAEQNVTGNASYGQSGQNPGANVG